MPPKIPTRTQLRVTDDRGSEETVPAASAAASRRTLRPRISITPMAEPETEVEDDEDDEDAEHSTGIHDYDNI
jgi:hypothetical protein